MATAENVANVKRMRGKQLLRGRWSLTNGDTFCDISKRGDTDT
jgi:hypothetical protein